MSGDLHLSGHTLATGQIRKHGRDRYPTAPAQFAKVLDEMGELAEALMNWKQAAPAGELAQVTREARAAVRREYADTGLALFELGNKLGLDLIQCMTELVDADERKF